MGFFTDIILRTVSRAGFVTKGIDLTATEVDNNFLAIVDEIDNRDVVGSFVAWSAGTVAAGVIRIYDSKLWLSLQSNSNVPSEGVDWTRINAAVAGHEQGTDTVLNKNGANQVTAAQLKALVDIKDFYFERTITPAEMLDAFDTPIELVPAQGANTIIVPTVITGQLVFGTTPYATNGIIAIYSGGANRILGFGGTSFLFASSSILSKAQDVASNQYVANSPLTLTVDTGNPTAGDSPVVIRGFYKVITVS